ncbi:MAG: hypothetical protein IT210_14300 [Armatimonadetes bacterium]|nr:hypothetical protein [Armatimonadota bacterium]
MDTCILALDLGTTAFKAAPVGETGLLARPVSVANRLDYAGGEVTCDPEEAFRRARRVLKAAARAAHQTGYRISAIGVSSQAQTYVALDRQGSPIQPFIVWTDARAVEEAREAVCIADYAALCGFTAPLPQQFLPKVMRFRRREGREASRFLLLNEYIIYRLTGEAYGDETNQGMGGFYDISRRAFSKEAMAMAGVTPDYLAPAFPSARFARALLRREAVRLGAEAVPVFSCGNDQSCAAAGAGLDEEGDILCNFGTAMVVYALKESFARPSGKDQIAGIQPLTGRYFLLGLESECGNIVEWLARLLYPRTGVSVMLAEAASPGIFDESLPILRVQPGRIDIDGLSVACGKKEVARALLDYYSDRFGAILKGVAGERTAIRRLFASGGLSRSRAWLDLLAARHGIAFIPTSSEHPALIGIERVVRKGAA